MKYIDAKGQTLSRFSLGSVQIGMTYGLGVHKAKPSQQTAFDLLDRAMEQGINTLDTANNYGDAEEVIGRWLQKRRHPKKSRMRAC